MNNKKLIKKLGFISVVAFGLNSYASDFNPKAMLDTNYTYNFNRPGVSTNLVGSPQNRLRYSDRGHNQFNLNQATLGFTKDHDPVGFELMLWAGTLADVESSDATYKMLKSANMTYGNQGAWTITLGKFGIENAYESIDSHNNWNYSRSWGFEMLPKYTLGAHFNFPFNDMLHLHFIIGNGADRHLDNNVGKLFGLNLHYGKGQATEANLGVTYSPERDNHNGNQRTTLALNVKHMYSDDFGLGFAGSYAHGRFEQVRIQHTDTQAEFAAATTAGVSVADYRKLEAAQRWSAAVYAMKSFMADHQTALRFEYAKDSRGAFVMNGANNTLIGTTLTHKYLATANLSFWGELRWDRANKPLYLNNKSDGKQNMWTMTLAATLSL